MNIKRLIKNLRYLGKFDLQKMDAVLENYKYEILDPLHGAKCLHPQLKNLHETIDVVCGTDKSISRFGDGELCLMLGRQIAFQADTTRIRQRLKDILASDDKGVMICLPNLFGSLSHLPQIHRNYWRYEFLPVWREQIYQHLNFGTQYYDALITRPYFLIEDKSQARAHFEKFKSIWQGRNVVIIEGDKTRMGWGNDLLSGAASVRRIIGPSLNAFDKYDDILDQACRLDKNDLILIALGPTATVLAYDLGKAGYRALDVGHLDIEYEWLLAGADTKIKIPGKFVYEAGGTNVPELTDKNYLEQVIAIIKS